jgi:hypothetical protein
MLHFLLTLFSIVLITSTNTTYGNKCIREKDVVDYEQNVVLKSRWAIVTLTKHGKQEVKRDIDKRNKLLAEKLKPYAQNHNFTFIFFSEFNIPSNVIQNWIDVFKDVGTVRYVNTRHLGFKGVFGYIYMCKFYSLDIYTLLKDYDYYMRCDIDCYIEKLDYDMFQWFENRNGGYGFASRKTESHKITVRTMPPWMNDYMSACSIVPASLMGSNFDYCFNFYNNWHIGRISFFNRPDVRHFLKSVNESGNYLKHHWGDSTVQAYTVRLFMDTDQILQVPNFTYIHGSHGPRGYRISTFIDDKSTWANARGEFLPFWKNTNKGL